MFKTERWVELLLSPFHFPHLLFERGLMAKKKTKKKTTKRTAKVKSMLLAKRKVAVPEFLHTGSTLLNLACSGDAHGGFPTGSFTYFVGDTKSGKTWFCLTCLAEASVDKRFDGYRFIFDNAERGARMDMVRYYGQRMADRLEPPRWLDGQPVYSETVEDFYYNVDDALEAGKPCIYILDSMDAVGAVADDEHFEKKKLARDKTKTEKKKVAGSYGTARAKINSQYLRRLMTRLEKTGSILIVISQTRDPIGFDSMFQTKTRGGGRALGFYATTEIWTSVVKELKREYKGKKRPIGSIVKLHVQKNRVNGVMSQVVVPFFHSVGLDEVGSCVDYLVEEGIWKKVDGKITATGLGPVMKGNREAIIRLIEERELGEDLVELVQISWKEIETAIAVKRKPRY